MPLPPNNLNSAVRILSAGDLQGSGFLIHVRGEDEGFHRYIATCHHVIRAQIDLEVQAANPFANGVLYDPEPVSQWRQPLPKVDLAIARFDGCDNLAYEGVWLDSAMPLDGLAHPDLGGHIYYIGMFAPLGRPMARSGRIGALFQSGIQFEGDYEYDSHLVDCRSYAGFSGSPVTEERSYPILDARQGPTWVRTDTLLGGMAYLTVLCGMFTAHMSDEVHPGSGGTASRYGVGVMLPSDRIKEALMSEEFIEERAKVEAERRAKREAGQPPLKNASIPNEDRLRDDVLADFETISGPLRGQNQDHKPKA
jgi:hypothetical protein